MTTRNSEKLESKVESEVESLLSKNAKLRTVAPNTEQINLETPTDLRKIVLVGECGVGKSYLLHIFLNKPLPDVQVERSPVTTHVAEVHINN